MYLYIAPRNMLCVLFVSLGTGLGCLGLGFSTASMQDNFCLVQVVCFQNNMSQSLCQPVNPHFFCSPRHVFFSFICTYVALVRSYCFQLSTLLSMSYYFSVVEGVLWVYGSSVQQPYQVCSQSGHTHIHTYCQLTRIWLKRSRYRDIDPGSAQMFHLE